MQRLVLANQEQKSYNEQLASAPVYPPASRLLELLGELRNKIYRYCLVVDDEHDTEHPMRITTNGRFVVVAKDLKIPPLLSVSQQVRNEAIHIWYAANTFRVSLPDYDPTLYLARRRHLGGIVGDDKSKGLWIQVTGDPKWSNLMDRCHAAWSGTLPCLEKDERGKLAVARAAHKIAVMSKEGSWEECERQLSVLRGVFAQIDKRWMD